MTRPDAVTGPPSGGGNKSGEASASSPVPQRSREKTPAQAAAAKFYDDATHLSEAAESRKQFFFLRSDSNAIHSLKDWSEKQWRDKLVAESLKKEARVLLKALFGADEGARLLSATSGDVDDAAKLIKQRIGTDLPLSEWRAIITFQNHALNEHHLDEEEGLVGYMESDLLSNYVFNREFPLGVEERLVQDRWAFAIENSGLHVVRHKGNALVTMAVYLAMLGVALAAIGFLAYKMSQDGTWTIADTMEDVNDPANAQKIVDRTKARRAILAIILARNSRAFRRNSLTRSSLPPAGARHGGVAPQRADVLALSQRLARQVWVDRPVDVDRPDRHDLGRHVGLHSRLDLRLGRGIPRVPVVADGRDGVRDGIDPQRQVRAVLHHHHLRHVLHGESCHGVRAVP